MKKTYSLTAALVCTALLSGCSSSPAKIPEPKTLSQLNIQPDDSLALKVLKAAGSAYNTRDVEVSATDWEQINGASGSVMALNMAAGTAGIGILGGSGLSG
ncbi:MAG: hypothetical protein ACRCVV_15610, partial [Shewanella sp.]